MPSDFLERLSRGPVLGDGGYYLELERRVIGSYPAEIPRAVLDHPEGVLELHREFARAGSELLQAMTWGVRPFDQERDLHHTAVELARQAAGPDRYVAGSLSPYLTLGATRWTPMTEARRAETLAFFERRVGQQVEAGVDLMIAETFYTVEEASLAAQVIKRAGVPAVVTFTFRDAEFTRDGFAPGEAAKRLIDAGADVVGVNCMRPWYGMQAAVRAMRAAVSVPMCVQPTAYELEPNENFNRALSQAGLWTRVEPRVVTRYAMAEYATQAEALGIQLIGACCGALPYHIRAMAEALGKTVELPDTDRGYRRST